MKKLALSFSFVICLVSSLFAQDLTGHVVYNVELSSDDPQMQMAIPMFAGTTLELFYTENKSRTILNMGTFISTVIMIDIKEDKMLMLMSGMMGNMAIPGVLSEIKDNDKGDDRDPQDDNIESEENDFEIVFTDETKEIQGYTCKKAIVSGEDGIEMIYWYTEDIKFSKEGQNYFNKDVPGFPMEFETLTNGMKMKMTVTEFSKTLGKDESELFDFSIPEGYKEMSMEELESMGQGR